MFYVLSSSPTDFPPSEYFIVIFKINVSIALYKQSFITNEICLIYIAQFHFIFYKKEVWCTKSHSLLLQNFSNSE